MDSTGPYHPGEVRAQQLAGLREQAEHSGRAVRTDVPPVAAAFLARQRVLVVGAADDTGRPWASLLTGPPGFVAVRADGSLDVAARPGSEDPLAEALGRPCPVGTIALQADTRRRMRVNGRATPTERGFRLAPDQVYANCPKYIAARTPSEPDEPLLSGPVSRTEVLTSAQQRLLGSCDTFFVATRSARGDADASHRGGPPGFLQVLGPLLLRWPDYAGNAMMMTLGNLVEDDRAGLLVLDHDTGTTVQLTGRASVRWAADPGAEDLPGAQRVVQFAVEHVLETPRAVGLTWSAAVPSPSNPPAPGAR